MTVYIEYAFLENFLFDGVLLLLALFAAKAEIKWYRILFSALLGAVFAILYPFLRLPPWLGQILKIAVGFLLCLLAFGRVKNKNEWGRYALSAVFFFILSFGYGGVLLGVTRGLYERKVPSIVVFIAFALLSGATLLLLRKLYQKKSVHAFIYKCRIFFVGKRVSAFGFFDSGNLATKNGLPVCFVAPDLFYELCGEETLFSRVESEAEICVNTLSGEKTVPLYRAELEIVNAQGIPMKKSVYFGMAANMISRDYKILLNGRIFE